MPGKYYEGIIQLRPSKSEIDRYIEKAVESSGSVSIAKKKLLKTGTDYYISSWKFSVSLGNELAKRFGGQITVSKKLFGKNRDGKIVYRCTVLYRPLPFERGDIVASGNRVFVVKFLGKVIIGRNLVTGKSEQLDLKEDLKKLKKQKAVVSMTSPRLEVISPEDYQSTVVENPGEFITGQDAEIVLYMGKAYLVC